MRPLLVCEAERGTCDLVVGAIYLEGTKGTIADEPIDGLLRCGNMGGFRVRGTVERDAVRLAVLFTTMEDRDWPDSLDERSARFIYFGDNKSPNRALHDTPKRGNELLRRCFAAVHVAPPRRDRVPPFFVFAKADPGRSVRFLGLAAPGAEGVPETEDLVAIWKTKGSKRFQNYRATFTILDAPRIGRAWIEDLLVGNSMTENTPEAWRKWARSGEYSRLDFDRIGGT